MSQGKLDGNRSPSRPAARGVVFIRAKDPSLLSVPKDGLRVRQGHKPPLKWQPPAISLYEPVRLGDAHAEPRRADKSGAMPEAGVLGAAAEGQAPRRPSPPCPPRLMVSNPSMSSTLFGAGFGGLQGFCEGSVLPSTREEMGRALEKVHVDSVPHGASLN